MNLYIMPDHASETLGIPASTLRAMLPKTGGQFRRRRIGKRYHWLLSDFLAWADRVIRPSLDIRTTERLIALARSAEEYQYDL